MVASRCPYRLHLRAAAIRSSTSLAVRYSRVRATEEFTMVGGEPASTVKAMNFPHPGFDTEGKWRVFPQCHYFLSQSVAATTTGLAGRLPLFRPSALRDCLGSRRDRRAGRRDQPNA